jgi:hypothetical protein
VAGTPHDDLRRLAVWLARRREVDELMAVLTQYGPTAGERVAGHLDALQALLDAEAESFGRYRSGAPVVPQKPLPTVVPRDGKDRSASVHYLPSVRRERGAPQS